jgi:hypothetical protein
VTTADQVGVLLARFAEVGRRVRDTYGPRSQARVFVLYEELISLRAVLAAQRHDARVAARVEVLRAQIGEEYLLSGGAAPPPRREILSVDPPLLEFDRALFERRYRGVCAQVCAQTVCLPGLADPLPRLRSGVPHMFVIDDRDRLLVWTRPFTMADLVFGRNRATVDGVPVAHPMLVPERLRARAAGEIVLIGVDRVAAVVANTKSGHFQPPRESVAVVRDTCLRVFGLTDADVDVFHLFPPAGALPERTAG